MDERPVILITGTRKGIGRYLAEYYVKKDFYVVGCSREPTDYVSKNYRHYSLDVCVEEEVIELFAAIKSSFKRLDILINNAGIASMNHFLLTPVSTAQRILNTNFLGTFTVCREAAKVMRRNRYGRIVNFTTVAAPLKLEGEAVYASSKAAILTFTQIIARELGEFGITVNAIGPAPVKTDLIRSVPEETLQRLISRQAIERFCEFRDIANVIDFFIRPESEFVTGQVIYLGGV